jgi:hypothetical protein
VALEYRQTLLDGAQLGSVRVARDLLMQSSEVSIDAVQAAIDPVEPAIDAVQAAIDPVEPAINAVQAAIDPVEPAIDAVQAAIDPVEPAIHAVEAFVKLPFRRRIEHAIHDDAYLALDLFKEDGRPVMAVPRPARAARLGRFAPLRHGNFRSNRVPDRQETANGS